MNITSNNQLNQDNQTLKHVGIVVACLIGLTAGLVIAVMIIT